MVAAPSASSPFERLVMTAEDTRSDRSVTVRAGPGVPEMAYADRL
jgi:hypothetical protein